MVMVHSCKQYGIELHHIVAYTNRSNGQAKRIFRIVKDGLTVISNIQQDHWEHNLLLTVQYLSKATGKAPMEWS